MSTFQVRGWSASMHKANTEYTVVKTTEAFPGIVEETTYKLEVPGVFMDYNDESHDALTSKLISVGMISTKEELKLFGA